MVSLVPFQQQVDEILKKTPFVCKDPRTDFYQLLSSYGFDLNPNISIGRITRIKGQEDKGNKKSGWYVYNEIEDSHNEGHVIGIANFGDWKTGINEHWCSRSQDIMSSDELARFKESREMMKIIYEQEKEQKQIEAAQSSYNLWSSLPNANEDHPYLLKKKSKAHENIKITNDNKLVMPIIQGNTFYSLQFIYPDGTKKLFTGGKKKGCYFVIKGNDDVIFITEGYSTGSSVNQATGFTCYIAIDVGNLYDVACQVKQEYPESRIIIAGDDDTETSGNPGRTKATQIASGLDIEVIFPEGYNDFNDMHVELGIDAVSNYIFPKSRKKIETNKKNKENKPSISKPEGILSSMIDYYNATSGNKQEGFAIHSSLAICSVILGRNFKTNLNNYSSLYLLCIGKSATGKEHLRDVVQDVLYETDCKNFISDDGYTSEGAVISQLLKKPKHISVIDEFGRYLEAGADLKKGNMNQREANTKLMQCISGTHSVVRPKGYSAMTVTKEMAKSMDNRHVYNPAITILATTTPDTFYNSIGVDAIKDGFINRFVISISEAKRTIRLHKEKIDVPDSIIQWVKNIKIRLGNVVNISSEKSKAITLNFTQEAYDEQIKYQEKLIKQQDELEKIGMAEICGRSNEMAMKISLIHALSRNPFAETIELQDIQWGIYYVDLCLQDTIKRLRMGISSSPFEKAKKEILQDLRDKGSEGITWSQMQKVNPYAKHKAKELKDILNALKDADLIADEPFNNNRGRPTTLWIALK